MIESDSSPIRVAFCVTELDPGGAERALGQLVTRLDRQVWSPMVIALGPETELSAELAAQGIPVHCLGAKGPRSLGIIFPLIRILKEFRPAILQTWMFHANILGRFAGFAARVPLVFSGIRVAEHSSRWHLWWERWTRGMVSHHVCVSQDVARFAIKHHRLREANVSVVPNGVDWEQFANAKPANLVKFGIPDGSRTILGVGRLHPQKGWLDLLEATGPLLMDDPQLHVMIIGAGPQLSTLEAWIEQRNLREQVHLPGWQADVLGVMRASDLLVLSSHWEGMPNVVLEAMASGLPLVVTDVAGVAEILPAEHRTNLIKPNDPLSLRIAITAAIEHYDRLLQDAVSAQLYMQKEFTWDMTAKKWSEIAKSKLRQ